MHARESLHLHSLWQHTYPPASPEHNTEQQTEILNRNAITCLKLLTNKHVKVMDALSKDLRASTWDLFITTTQLAFESHKRHVIERDYVGLSVGVLGDSGEFGQSLRIVPDHRHS